MAAPEGAIPQQRRPVEPAAVVPVAGAPVPWFAIDYLAAGSRVVSLLIDWYLRPAWRRKRFLRALRAAYHGDRTVRGLTMGGDLDGPHLLPQGQQQRSAAAGQRWDAEGQRLTGGNDTLVVIYWPKRDAYVFYLHTDPRHAVVIPRVAARALGSMLTGGGREN